MSKKHWITLAGLGAITATAMIAAETDTSKPALENDAGKAATPTPAEWIATRCLICHGDPAAGAKRLAPPFRMVKMHYADLSEEAFVKAIAAWVKQPDKTKSKMPGAIRNFGLMPPLPLPDAEITAIATYLYRTDFPMPRGGGMGRGQGATGTGKQPPCETDCPPDPCGTETTETEKTR